MILLLPLAQPPQLDGNTTVSTRSCLLCVHSGLGSTLPAVFFLKCTLLVHTSHPSLCAHAGPLSMQPVSPSWLLQVLAAGLLC